MPFSLQNHFRTAFFQSTAMYFYRSSSRVLHSSAQKRPDRSCNRFPDNTPSHHLQSAHRRKQAYPQPPSLYLYLQIHIHIPIHSPIHLMGMLAHLLALCWNFALILLDICCFFAWRWLDAFHGLPNTWHCFSQLFPELMKNAFLPGLII